MKLIKTGNLVEFIYDIQGNSVTILRAVIKNAYDLPRLYDIAKTLLVDFKTQMNIKN